MQIGISLALKDVLAGQPSFFAPLLTSLAAALGTGSPTFTRATTAIVCDWEMRCYPALSGEARFQGARRVYNRLPISSESFAAWTKTNSTITAGISDHLGGTSASTLTATAGGGFLESNVGVSDFPSGAYAGCGSIWIRRRTGVGNVSARTAGITDVVLPVTTSWQRLSWTGNAIDTTLRFRITLATIGDEVDVWWAQNEVTTGQSNQNPSEYVSKGVLAAPYHGANVDGVKYFTTQNGNTVASNVVTEATGAAIGSTTLLGFLSEQQSTNLVLQSENFGTTWAAVGTPTRSAAALRCGAVVLDLIGDDDAAALEGYNQAFTFTGDAVKAISLYFAQGTSTSTAIRLRDNTAAADRLTAVITWAAGVPTVTMTVGTLLGVDTLGNGVFRARMASTSVTAANTNAINIYPATTNVFAVANTGTIYAGGVQAENNTFCTSYIPTTTATVTRNIDVLSYSSTNISGTVGTSFAEIVAPVAAGGVRPVVNVGANEALYQASTGELSVFDGAVERKGNALTNSSAIQKAASIWGGVASKTFIAGVASASLGFDGDLNVAGLFIGTANGAAPSFNGTIRNVKLWKSVLRDSAVAAL